MTAFKGKTVLITGASSGLGAHFARVLATEGALVGAAARRSDALRTLSEENHAIRPIPLDVSKPASVAEAVAEAKALSGRLDAVINNAGIAWGGRALEMDEQDWARVLDINLSGVFRVAQASANAMRDNPEGGAIVNIASILGLGVQPGVAAYAASKAGVIQLTRALALEWARHGIRVNALAPGFIPTEINAEHLSGEAGAALIKAIPLRRLGRPEDLDAPLKLLLGAGGAYMTGVTIPVDGGHLCRSL
ncbi:MAG: SDR family NAD(P)-dependent oxidoreductase [Pseudomonadota bacterium]